MENTIESTGPTSSNNENQNKTDEENVVPEQIANPKSLRPKDLVHKCVSDPSSSSTTGQTDDSTLVKNDRRLYYRERRRRRCRQRGTDNESPEDLSGANIHNDDDGDNDDDDYEDDNDEQLESPGQNALCPKGLFSRSVRYPSSAPMTRKCVLTLDGYSYVIVASTPENRAVRDEIVAGAVERLTTERRNSNSPTSSTQSSIPINGQVSKQGSLTIVRRSNSRKGNLSCQADSQFLLQSPTQQAQSTSIGLAQDQLLLSSSSSHQQVLAGITSPSETVTNITSPITSKTAVYSQKTTSDTLVTWTIDQNQSEVRLAGSGCSESDSGRDLRQHQREYFNMQALQQTALTPTSSSSSSAVPGDVQNPTGGGSSTSSSLQQQLQLLPSAQFNTDMQLETIDLASENLPAVDTPDACDKAALRLRCLLRLLQRGEISAEILQKNLHYAATVLEAVFIDETKSPNTDNREFNNSGQNSIEKERLADEDDELSEVQPDAVPPEVREWLASTFTRQLATTRKRTDEKPKFRSVAHAIRAGIFVDRIYRRVSSTALMQFPPEVVKVLKTLDDWSFDVFALADAANGQPLKYMGYDLLNRYGIIHKFKIGPVVLETFLNRIEEGYCRYRNPYHNNLHGADVTQSMHYMLSQTGLMNWLTDLEIFATLLAAMMHDYEHTGTTNNFHVMSLSDFALLYNDRAVMENHHVSAAYRLLKDDDCNILSNLSREEFRELRTLIVDMVLSTDMSYHFQQLKNMKNLLTITDPAIDKSKALSLVLHCCDISHPAKKWSIHHRWTMLLLEEFFRQGDLERELGLPFSPLCDRNNTLVAESQIGFIDFIVDPSMSVCSDMLEYVLAPIAPMCKTANASIDEAQTGSNLNSTSTIGKPSVETINEGEVSNNESDDTNKKFRIRKPWLTILTENKKIWKEQSVKDAEARAVAAALEEKTKTPSEEEAKSSSTDKEQEETTQT